MQSEWESAASGWKRPFFAMVISAVLALFAGWALLLPFEGALGASCGPLILGGDQGDPEYFGSGLDECDVARMDRELIAYVAVPGLFLSLGFVGRRYWRRRHAPPPPDALSIAREISGHGDTPLGWVFREVWRGTGQVLTVEDFLLLVDTWIANGRLEARLLVGHEMSSVDRLSSATVSAYRSFDPRGNSPDPLPIYLRSGAVLTWPDWRFDIDRANGSFALTAHGVNPDQVFDRLREIEPDLDFIPTRSDFLPGPGPRIKVTGTARRRLPEGERPIGGGARAERTSTGG